MQYNVYSHVYLQPGRPSASPHLPLPSPQLLYSPPPPIVYCPASSSLFPVTEVSVCMCVWGGGVYVKGVRVCVCGGGEVCMSRASVCMCVCERWGGGEACGGPSMYVAGVLGHGPAAPVRWVVTFFCWAAIIPEVKGTSSGYTHANKQFLLNHDVTHVRRS